VPCLPHTMEPFPFSGKTSLKPATPGLGVLIQWKARRTLLEVPISPTPHEASAVRVVACIIRISSAVCLNCASSMLDGTACQGHGL